MSIVSTVRRETGAGVVCRGHPCGQSPRVPVLPASEEAQSEEAQSKEAQSE